MKAKDNKIRQEIINKTINKLKYIEIEKNRKREPLMTLKEMKDEMDRIFQNEDINESITELWAINWNDYGDDEISYALEYTLIQEEQFLEAVERMPEFSYTREIFDKNFLECLAKLTTSSRVEMIKILNYYLLLMNRELRRGVTERARLKEIFNQTTMLSLHGDF